ncbi:MAG: DUF3025 domain-containing protein [Betaproteobacteria bacterium]
MKAASVQPIAPLSWADAATILPAPYFDGIRAPLQELQCGSKVWPTLEQLNALSSQADVRNASGRSMRFVAPQADATSAMHYETQIANTGEVPTRDNWHDLFNALQWIAFPAMKSSLNAQHLRLLAAGGAKEATARSTPRDVLTMFDESGVVVASADDSLLALIRKFDWRTLFVERRRDVESKMHFVLVGHGLMEKSLKPFIGLTAKAMLLNMDVRNTSIDHAVAGWLKDDANLQSSHNLAPLPLLGIPGWDVRNESASFYQNTDYFRPGRRNS